MFLCRWVGVVSVVVAGETQGREGMCADKPPGGEVRPNNLIVRGVVRSQLFSINSTVDYTSNSLSVFGRFAAGGG